MTQTCFVESADHSRIDYDVAGSGPAIVVIPIPLSTNIQFG